MLNCWLKILWRFIINYFYRHRHNIVINRKPLTSTVKKYRILSLFLFCSWLNLHPFSMSSTQHLTNIWLSYQPDWWWRSLKQPVLAQGSEARHHSLPTPQRCSWYGPAARWWTPWFPSGSAAAGWSGCHYHRPDSAGRQGHSAYTPHCMSSPGVLLNSGVDSTPGLQKSHWHWRLGGQALMEVLWRWKKKERSDVITSSC